MTIKEYLDIDSSNRPMVYLYTDHLGMRRVTDINPDTFWVVTGRGMNELSFSCHPDTALHLHPYTNKRIEPSGSPGGMQ